MTNRVLTLFSLASVLVVVGCGTEPVPATPTPPSFAQAPGDEPSSQSTALNREVFSYRGSVRDPFRSLMSATDANLRPFFEDLRLVSVQYDGSVPARSVAILRDTTLNDRYTIKVGDRLGRLRVTEIRPGQVIFTRQNLGVSEQVLLETRRRGQGGLE